MNLRDYMEAIEAGGVGSGCRGPNCGRPAGHVGPHGPEATSWIQKKADQALREQAFKDERKRLGLLKVGLRRKQLEQVQQKQAEEAGTLRRKDVKELKKAGQVIDMKSPGLKLKTDIARVLSSRIEKIKLTVVGPRGGVKTYTVKAEVETVRMLGGPRTPQMGKTRGKNVPEGPPGRAHSLYGKFVEVHAFNEDDRQFRAYEATTSIHETLRGPISGAGASLFVNKETTGNKSTISIQEVKRGPHASIEETNTYKFKSGKGAKDFLHQRYGIKNVRWTILQGNEK